MIKSSLTNLALRGILIWLLTFYFVSSIPSANVPVSSKLLIATLVVLMYIIIEYIVFTLIIPRGVCRVLCGNVNYASRDDKYIRAALRRLKLQERAGPAVQPSFAPGAQVSPIAPIVAPVAPIAPIQPVAPIAPIAPVSPIQSVAPPAPVSPPAPVVPSVAPVQETPVAAKVGGSYYW